MAPKAERKAERTGYDADYLFLREVAAAALKQGDARPLQVLAHYYRQEAQDPGAAIAFGRWKRTRALFEPGERAGEAVTRTLKGKRRPGRADPHAAYRAEMRAKARDLDRLRKTVKTLALPTSDLPSPFAAVRPTGRDPLANMELSRGQARAARVLRALLDATLDALVVKGATTREVRVDTSLRVPDPTRTIPEHIARLRRWVYRPWAEAQERIRVRPGLTARGLAYRVVYEREPLGRLERDHRVSFGTFGPVLRAALGDFARRLGHYERNRPDLPEGPERADRAGPGPQRRVSPTHPNTCRA